MITIKKLEDNALWPFTKTSTANIIAQSEIDQTVPDITVQGMCF